MFVDNSVFFYLETKAPGPGSTFFTDPDPGGQFCTEMTGSESGSETLTVGTMVYCWVFLVDELLRPLRVSYQNIALRLQNIRSFQEIKYWYGGPPLLAIGVSVIKGLERKDKAEDSGRLSIFA